MALVHDYPQKPLIVPHPLIVHSVPLAPKNWFNTGGSALYFAEPTSTDEFQSVTAWAQLNNLPTCLIGEGANMLINDAGYDGLIIRPQLHQIQITEESDQHALVKAGAGVSFGKLIEWCLAHNLSGLEEFSGIPGTVGGSVFINIHYYEFLLSDFLVNAEVIHKQSALLSFIDKQWFKFGYNRSTLQEGTHYLASASFRLKKITNAETHYAKGRSAEIIRHRAKRYPEKGTCGSFFRNFTPEEVAATESKLIYVAYYLDKIGIKGDLSYGGAQVSHQHANMIVNKGNATSQDIITIAQTMQQRVYTTFGIMPQPECRFIGFNTYPLLT